MDMHERFSLRVEGGAIEDASYRARLPHPFHD